MQAPISEAESIPEFHIAACSNPSDALCSSEKRMCSLMPLMTKGLFFEINVAKCMEWENADAGVGWTLLSKPLARASAESKRLPVEGKCFCKKSKNQINSYSGKDWSSINLCTSFRWTRICLQQRAACVERFLDLQTIWTQISRRDSPICDSWSGAPATIPTSTSLIENLNSLW